VGDGGVLGVMIYLSPLLRRWSVVLLPGLFVVNLPMRDGSRRPPGTPSSARAAHDIVVEDGTASAW